MDALSSQATVAGYKAVLLAAERLPRFFPMLTTAAGTIAPARVLVLGAGVAGLQAIATARRLGAVVSGFDVRPAVREQVQSLGATFLDLGVVGEETEGGYARELTPEEQQAQQRGARGADPRLRRGDHDRRDPGPARAEADPGRRGRGDAPGLGDRRPRRRDRRQLRADASPGETVERGGVTIIGPPNLAEHDADAREPALRAQRLGAARAPRPRRRAQARLGRRDHRRHVRARDASAEVAPHEPLRAARRRADDPGARDLPRRRGDLEGADAAAHAADVGHERDPRDRDRRRDDRRRRDRSRTCSRTGSGSSR